MGCCSSRQGEALSDGERRIKNRQMTGEISSLFNTVEENKDTLCKEVLILVYSAKEQKFDKMFSMLASTQNLKFTETRTLRLQNLPVKTIGSLSLHILISIAKEDSLVLLQALIRNMETLMSVLQSKSSCKDSLIEFLCYFTCPEYKRVKEQLLRLDCFTIFVPMFTTKTRNTRIQVAAICDFVYAYSSTAQAAFFQNQGEVALLQLIVREGEDEEILLELLDFVFDLMVDENEEVNSYGVQKIMESNFHDHVLNLNIHSVIFIQRSIAAIEMVDKIICQFPES